MWAELDLWKEPSEAVCSQEQRVPRGCVPVPLVAWLGLLGERDRDRGRPRQRHTGEEAESVVPAGGPSPVGSGADGRWGAVWELGSQAGRRELACLGGLPTPSQPSNIFLITWCPCAQGGCKQLRWLL